MHYQRIAVPAVAKEPLTYIAAVGEKYTHFTSEIDSIPRLIEWAIGQNVRFSDIRLQKWPDLRKGLNWESLYRKNLQPALDNFKTFFGEEDPRTQKLIGIFHQLFSLVVMDQVEDTAVIQEGIPTYLFGPHAQGRLSLLHPDQLAVGSVAGNDGVDFLYAKNLGDRVAFSAFRHPENISEDPLFENQFFDLQGRLLPQSDIAFSVIRVPSMPDSAHDIYVQNKILALQNASQVGQEGIKGGVMVLKGIPSTEVLNWIVQRNVQAVKVCPHVEVVILLELPVRLEAGKAEETRLPYMITIKASDHFRWKKDNVGRVLTETIARAYLAPGQKFSKNLQTKMKTAYQEAKRLIKENLKWVPAHELCIQINKTRAHNLDFSKAFWEMVREKESHSGLPAIPFASLRSDNLSEFLTTELGTFIGWVVAMANGCPDAVPVSVRVPLRSDMAKKRLGSIDPTCLRTGTAEDPHRFPSAEKIQALVDELRPKFQTILEKNQAVTEKCYRLPMAPIIGDFLAEHLEFGSSLRIQDLSVLTPEILENDFKAQVNYSLTQAVYILRYSEKSQLVQASDHVSVQKKYGTAEELAKEFEKSLFQSYAMCLCSFPKEEAVNEAHVTAISNLIDKIIGFNRGEHVRTLWAQLYKDLKLNKLPIPSIKKVHISLTEKLKKQTPDTKIDSVDTLKAYYTMLYTGFSLTGMPLEAIQQFVKLHGHAYATPMAEFGRQLPQLSGLLASFRPIKDVPQLRNALLPIMFENISPDFLPVSETDRVLVLTFPPASFAIHWVKYIYVVDVKDQVKLSPEMLTGKQKGKRISHSQLADWGPVVAAGEIFFAKVNGRWECVQINNGSGHYEPDAEGSLLKAKAAIQAALEKTTIVFNPEIRNVLLPGVPAHSFLRQF